jgi:hypothetical protein
LSEKLILGAFGEILVSVAQKPNNMIFFKTYPQPRQGFRRQHGQ